MLTILVGINNVVTVHHMSVLVRTVCNIACLFHNAHGVTECFECKCLKMLMRSCLLKVVHQNVFISCNPWHTLLYSTSILRHFDCCAVYEKLHFELLCYNKTGLVYRSWVSGTK